MHLLSEIQKPQTGRIALRGPQQLQTCRFFLQGHCNRGVKCKFSHVVGHPLNPKSLHDDTAVTLQQVMLGSTMVIFGAGIGVQRIITGFDSFSVVVSGLPADTTRGDVQEMFTRAGLEACRFRVLGLRPTPGGDDNQEANVIFDVAEERARAVATLGAGEALVRDQMVKLTAVVRQNGAMGGMDASPESDPNVLRISWLAPSVSVVVTYASLQEAQDHVRTLEGRMCTGRQVKVFMNRPLLPNAGRMASSQNTNSIIIHGLPPSADSSAGHAAVRTLTGSTALRFLKPKDYDLDSALLLLRLRLEALSAPGALQELKVISRNASNGIVVVQVPFATRADAKKAYSALPSFLQSSSFPKPRLLLPEVIRYTLRLPAQQHEAQLLAWNALAADTQNKAAASVRIDLRAKDKAKNAIVLVHVGGEDKRAVGALKVRVETLAAGVPLARWHPAFATSDGRRFFADVLMRGHVFVRCDTRLKTLRLCGEAAAIERAREAITREADRLTALEVKVVLQRQSVRFFVREGMNALTDALGEAAVTLDIFSNPPTMVYRGGDDARQLLDRLIAESLTHKPQRTVGDVDENGEEVCPVCVDMPAHPERLACGHVYCTNCLRHFLTTAATRTTFPLVCMGTGAQCGSPIPIPVIRRFVPAQHAFDALLRAAFLAHLERHTDEYKFCTTPDCTQIYRASTPGSEGAFVECPSCFAAVCTACHEEAHESFSCGERAKVQEKENERLFSVWAGQNGVKHCPACKIPIERIDGCNHISCRCVYYVPPLRFFLLTADTSALLADAGGIFVGNA